MPGFQSYSEFISGSVNAGRTETFLFAKLYTSTVNTHWSSPWLGTGFPVAGATPSLSPGTSYTNATGSITFLSQSEHKYVSSFGLYNPNGTQASSAMLCDRLVAVSGISLSGTGDVTINSVALPRYTDGVGVEAWLEVTTATTTAAPEVRISSYTNQNGTTGKQGLSVTFPLAATTANAMVKLPLGDADTGLQSIQTLTVVISGSTGVANLVLLKPLLMIAAPENSYNEVDQILQRSPPIRVFNGASLQFLMFGPGGIQTIAGVVGMTRTST